MKVVYMDPNDPLPDRQYYGRVQLIEVKNANGMDFPFFPVTYKKYSSKMCRNTKYLIILMNIS